jgi:RNA recognition motif-containing protein
MIVMTETLASLFKPYKPILPITAHRNVRMRGQAFITFSDVEHANKARKEVNEFPLYGKPMVRAFALVSPGPGASHHTVANSRLIIAYCIREEEGGCCGEEV